MYRFFFSMRFRLILLVLCAIIPALGVTLYSGLEQRRIAATQAKEEALRLARLLSNSQNELIEGGRHLLYTLAQLPQVRKCDSAFCCSLFADLLKQYPWYLNIGAAKPDGSIFASAVPMDQPVNIADRSYFQLALQTRNFAIGDYQIGRIVGKPVVNFGYPVLDEAGKVKAVVYVALSLDWLSQLAAKADLPPGSTLTVVNHNGLILARHPEPEKWVGRSMKEEFLFKAIGSQGEGMTEATGMDGVQRLYAFTAFGGPVHAGRIYVKIGIPASVAFAQVNRLLSRNLILLAFISLMALAIAWIGGDLLVRRRMSKLVSAAKGLGAGDLSVRTGVTYGEGELSQLARAFDEMAASLQQRESERKKAEEALQENRQALETVVETAPSLIVLTNPEGRIRLFNRACEELTGYKREEVIGNTIPKLFLPPEWVPLVQKRFSDPYAPEVRAPHENPWITKSGEERLIEWRCTPLPSSQDGQPWILGTGIDITERKQAQEALRRSEEEARRLAQENAIVAEIGRIISSTLKIEEVYDRFAEEVRKLIPGDRISIAIGNLEESNLTTAYVWGFEMADRKAGDIIPMVGTTSERVMRTRSSMLVQEENLEEVVDAFPGALPYFQAGFRSMMVVPLVSKDQAIGVLHIRSFKTNAYTEMDLRLAEKVGNQIAGAIANVQLFLDRKRAEEQLKRSEEHFRSLIENSSDIIITIDRNQNISYVSPSVKRILGYQSEYQIGWNVFQSVHPNDLPSVKEFVNKILQNHRQEIPSSIEHRLKHSDGSWRIFQSIGMSMFDDSGSPVIIVNSRDITERKNLEGQLAQAQKLEAIGQLAAGIAHDFNNILAAIMGYTELAIWDLPENSKANDKLKEALKASRRAKDLVRQILAFSRQKSEERKPMEIASIVKETIKLLRASLPSNIEIRQQIERDTLVINTNPTQIHQVLMNLCTNAAHAMRENGGLLEIGLSKVDIDAVVAARYPDIHPGSYVRLSVSDTGHGMSPDILAKIFNPYFTTKQVGEGSGLGLAVVHGIVKSHEGEITVYSEPGKGTTFQVYLPRIEHAKEVADIQRIEPFPMGRYESILFIDDEQALADIGKRMLEHLGYKVSVRTSSIEALELFRAKAGQFDLVITDMTMPNMTGDKLAREMMRIRPGIPIILCTGFSEYISEEKAKEIGIRKFVMKPLVMGDLARTVRRVLDHKGEKES
ncbi:MAG: PAS domain S-box protein [Deltaproteobacteria bacterium]|nr:PAS domain S-box protein [Deltaproteobacteria bacterium]